MLFMSEIKKDDQKQKRYILYVKFMKNENKKKSFGGTTE